MSPRFTIEESSDRAPLRNSRSEDIEESSNTDSKRITRTSRLLTDGGQAQEMESQPDEGEEAEQESESEETEEESEGEETEEESEEDADDDDLEITHGEDAEAVYEGDETSNVVHLDLDGLFLDVLGLEVNLNPVTLDVSARPGENNLLGNLLSAVSGLLDGPSALTDSIKSMLRKPLDILGSIVTKPREILSRFFDRLFRRSADTEAEDDEDAESKEESDQEGILASVFGWIKQRVTAVFGWVKSRIVGLIPGLPIEELVSSIVREILSQALEELEPEGTADGEETADEAAAETEATS